MYLFAGLKVREFIIRYANLSVCSFYLILQTQSHKNMDNQTTLTQLSAEEIRVLGVLIEKSKTTPDYYPMTINAITTACNQKSSRKPIVDYSEETVAQTIKSLRLKGLVATDTGGTSRTIKFRHCITVLFNVSQAGLSILCLLFLRGALTPGEINSNSGRLYDFESLEEVLLELKKLKDATPPFVKELPKQAGQKETRFIHLFGEYLPGNDAETNESHSNNTADLEARLTVIEQELAEVKENLAKLMKELLG